MRWTVIALLAAAALAPQARAAEDELLQRAEQELFAARFQEAARLYQEVLAHNSAEFRAFPGLVRALIEGHRSKEAYQAAERALQAAPETAAAKTAAGLAAYRQADISKAQNLFLAALKLDPRDAAALHGLANVNRAVSRFQSARVLDLDAYKIRPDDPALIVAYANTLEGAPHVAALQKALAILDPETERGRSLRSHIAGDLALGDRKTRQLVSPYAAASIKLQEIRSTPTHKMGVGLRVQFNGGKPLTLLLDTGASGIGISPKLAGRAGLEQLGNEAADMKGIGDNDSELFYRYIASQVRIGDVIFSNYPVSVFRAAASSDYDGLIGADVFRQFLVTIDCRRAEISLEPRADATDPDDPGQAADAGAPAPGFHRVLRFGNHLAVPTEVNGGPSALFLVDSGASANLIDTETAARIRKTYRDGQIRVKGVQGEVKEVSLANSVDLVFAGFRQSNASLIGISLEKMSDSLGAAFGGILGVPTLGQLRITIDYRTGTVRMVPAN